MWGNNRVRWTNGGFHSIGFLKTTELAITNADADSATGVIKRGKLMDYKAGSIELMAYGSGYFEGILTEDVSLNGLGGDAGFKNFTIGKLDNPKKRGAAVSIRVPHPGAECEFEGGPADTAIVDNLVCTSGTGAIAANTARLTELSVLNGCWRKAQAGEHVMALLLDANLVPETASNIRMRVRFVSPYIKA